MQTNMMLHGDRSKLSHDELNLLDQSILPTARRWLLIPQFAEHAMTTLEFWREPLMDINGQFHRRA